MRLCHTSPATPWSTSGSMVSRVPYSRSRWGPTSWHHDKIPHCRLIEKFKTNNVTGKLLTLIFNWLLHWTQRTVLNGESFDWSSVISGVQQGSVLDPLAFMIYIDDLEKSAVPSTVLNKLWQICRSFHFKNEKTFVTLYKQYVRPHLEYVIAAWSPWKVAGKELLERVQRRIVRSQGHLIQGQAQGAGPPVFGRQTNHIQQHPILLNCSWPG